MKVHFPIFIFSIHIIFADSTDYESTEVDSDQANSDILTLKDWPEQSFPSGDEQVRNDLYPVQKDPFWGNSNAYKPPWVTPELPINKLHLPLSDSSIPVWQLKGSSINSDDSDYGDSSIEDGSIMQLKSAQGEKERGDLANKMDEAEMKQHQAELLNGDMTRLFGTNVHLYQPENYRLYDLGRRFVPQYPYHEIHQNNLNQDEEDPSLIPKRAPPELVLAIAKESALIQGAQPVDPDEHLIKKESLRSGKYWNSFWKEEVEDPSNTLRSPKRNKLSTIATKLSPGTPIYEYVSKLNNLYPKLLYVINKTK